MRNILLIGLIIIVLMPLACITAQTKALFFTVDFMEKLEQSSWQVVDSREFVARLGIDFHFSMGNFSYVLSAQNEDDSLVTIQSQVNCFDQRQRNFFNTKLVSLGASIFFDSVLVREQSFFRIRVTLDSLGKIEKECEYTYRGSDFVYDPSSDFDFYFIRGTLGDYRWNEIRDVIERGYDWTADKFGFRDPTKINYYISPCRLSDVGWDDRWNNAIDLSRNNLFAHFTHGINGINPQTVYMLKLLRQWGYAPAFLLEGAASINEFCDHFARQYFSEAALPPIGDLMVSSKHRAVSRQVSANTAGSFVGYLITSYGFDNFRRFYRRVTDLTFEDIFKKVYDRELSAVENEWHNYLDTLTIDPELYKLHTHRMRLLMKQEMVALYLGEYLRITGDTLSVGSRLANLHFHFGDYQRARDILQGVANHDSSKAITESYLANLFLAMGEIEQARKLYRITLESDTTIYLPYMKLGLIEFYQGNIQNCIDYMYHAWSKTKSKPIKIDIDITLGDAFQRLGEPDSARYHYEQALNSTKILLGSFNDNPLYFLRAGKAALRLGEPQYALDNLGMAFFLEERIFYIGQIFLATGQAYDLLGEREKAKQEYRNLFAYPTAFLDQEMADNYMQTPYTNE